VSARVLRLGTRGSALALAQSGQVAGALTELGLQVELVTVQTLGDVNAAAIATAVRPAPRSTGATEPGVSLSPIVAVLP
jgi:hydroxymethylbilane synthase